MNTQIKLSDVLKIQNRLKGFVLDFNDFVAKLNNWLSGNLTLGTIHSNIYFYFMQNSKKDIYNDFDMKLLKMTDKVLDKYIINNLEINNFNFYNIRKYIKTHDTIIGEERLNNDFITYQKKYKSQYKLLLDEFDIGEINIVEPSYPGQSFLSMLQQQFNPMHVVIEFEKEELWLFYRLNTFIQNLCIPTDILKSFIKCGFNQICDLTIDKAKILSKEGLVTNSIEMAKLALYIAKINPDFRYADINQDRFDKYFNQYGASFPKELIDDY